MKLPRNAKIFRGQLDLAPFAGVLFLLIIFVTLNSSLVFTPGVPVDLPRQASAGGVTGPAVSVVVDRFGQFFFANQQMNAAQLEEHIREAVGKYEQSLTLIVQADVEVSHGVVAQLGEMARRAGIPRMMYAVDTMEAQVAP